jgi:hypothetical protein
MAGRTDWVSNARKVSAITRSGLQASTTSRAGDREGYRQPEFRHWGGGWRCYYLRPRQPLVMHQQSDISYLQFGVVSQDGHVSGRDNETSHSRSGPQLCYQAGVEPGRSEPDIVSRSHPQLTGLGS